MAGLPPVITKPVRSFAAPSWHGVLASVTFRHEVSDGPVAPQGMLSCVDKAGAGSGARIVLDIA